ncbi:MAG: 16S rRNA (adenine(1518)-N(6)/adenine(1519)-N(6))-dimethyltransferase RsmA [Clostridiales bacterium]
MSKDHPALAALRRQGFRFKKELGQNFLFNSFILEEIADGAGVTTGDLVIEVGAGAGTLTAELAARGARVKSIELDRSLVPYLRQRFKEEPAVEIIQGDAMKLDLEALALQEGRPTYKIAANLPYHISTPFVTMAFRQLKGLEGGAIMLQKEVADKILASPGDEGYGLLALAAAWYGEVKLLMELEPDYFTPPPPVNSAVITFRRRPPALVDAVEEKALWLVIRGLFNQRRKSLLNGLKSLGAFLPAGGKSWQEVLEEAGIDSRRRPETLALEEFGAIVTIAGYGAKANA